MAASGDQLGAAFYKGKALVTATVGRGREVSAGVTDPGYKSAARVIKDLGVRHGKTGQGAPAAPGSPN